MKQADTPMTIGEVIAVSTALYGDRWVPRLAEAIEYDHSVIWRLANAEDKGKQVSRRLARAVRRLTQLKKYCICII